MDERELIIKYCERLEKKLDRLHEDITAMKIASARRDGKLYVIIAVFGSIGGAVMDYVKGKLLS